MLDQGSPAWIRERVGKATASRMADMVDFVKDGKPDKDGVQKYKDGAARIAYKEQLVTERRTDRATEFFVTKPMQHGIEYEPVAAEEYELYTGEILEMATWHDHPAIEFFGATPDRYLGRDGLVEIKCPQPATFTRWLITREIPERYQWQMKAQLCCTRRRFCDFVAFDPFAVRGQRLWIKRFEPTQEELEQCESAARVFLLEVDRLFDLVTQEAA